jgi:uncharacterized membrane protein YadS
VLAILLGVAVRSCWKTRQGFPVPVSISARRTLLEVAVMLLGASISASAVAAQGRDPARRCRRRRRQLAILASYGIGRLMGLERRMAILIACGNSICGNSAIAAAAPGHSMPMARMSPRRSPSRPCSASSSC